MGDPKQLILLLTYMATFACIAVLFAPALGGSGRDAYLTLAVSAGLALTGTFLIPLALNRFHLTVKPWVMLAIPIASMVLLALPLASRYVHSDRLSSLIFDGLGVGQAGRYFTDLATPFEIARCFAEGYDVYVPGNGCVDPPIYGPSLLVLAVIPGELHASIFTVAVGILLALATSVAAGLLARFSGSIGALALLACVLSGSWILLLERGNLDALFLILAVVASVLISRYPVWWSWAIAALLFWFLGTLKYYPFAMGLALIPALWVRKGWAVVVGYLLASVAFMSWAWPRFALATGTNSGFLEKEIAGSNGEISPVAKTGRLVLSHMAGTSHAGTWLDAVTITLLLLVVSALAWGVLEGLSKNRVRVPSAVLAVSGSTLYIASSIAGGFAYSYKTVPLLLCIPILSDLGAQMQRRWRYACIVMLTAIVLSMTVVGNPVLTTISGTLAASFAFGVAIAMMLLLVRRSMAQKQEPLTEPHR